MSDSDNGSPSYSAALKSLLSKAKRVKPLTPSASPRTQSERQEEHRMTRQVLDAVSAHMDATRKTEEESRESSRDLSVGSINPEAREREREQEPEEEEPDPVTSRFKSVVPEPPYIPSPLKATDFCKVLLDNAPTKATEREDNAFIRLFTGYEDTEAAWVKELEPLVVARQSWTDTCTASIANDQVEDLNEKLLVTHKLLASKPGLDRGVFFVDYVLRCIATLKFIWVWIERGEDRNWKTTYLDRACRHDNARLYDQRDEAPAGSQLRKGLDGQIKKAEQRFRSDHSRAILERKILALLYEHFGPGIFLDETWDAIGDSASKAAKRSVTFHKLSQQICTKLPTYPEVTEQTQDLPYPVLTYEQNADSLYRILRILSGSETVPDYVQAFMEAHPPKQYGMEWNWGYAEIE
ncbi:hypothetical protein B0H17DRAFT_1209851 [Mycena rosella]|uniref:Uncharacterized protein n=1 Tax=Mycena rosella TaxID=1033263 RepID=A0AAD7G9F2_MYCRO|nr:hypothetical protein B0H17DRAFT_1209851 [Mycena rosella]